MAGAYISTNVYTSLVWLKAWLPLGLTALALTTFATWRPVRVLLGVFVWWVTMLQFPHFCSLRGAGGQPAAVDAAHVATIATLVLISRNPTWIRANMPASLQPLSGNLFCFFP